MLEKFFCLVALCDRRGCSRAGKGNFSQEKVQGHQFFQLGQSLPLIVASKCLFCIRIYLLHDFFILFQAIDVGLVVYDSDNVDKNSTEDLRKPLEPFLTSGGIYIPYLAGVPFLSIYNHLIIYLFLPIHRQLVAFVFGMFATLISILVFATIELNLVSNRTIQRYFGNS